MDDTGILRFQGKVTPETIVEYETGVSGVHMKVTGRSRVANELYATVVRRPVGSIHVNGRQLRYSCQTNS